MATTPPDLRRALQISAAWLAFLSRHFGLNETSQATLRHDGEIIGEFTLGEALNIADRALEPATPPTRQAVNECPCCKRMFKDGETCVMGGGPMGGDF